MRRRRCATAGAEHARPLAARQTEARHRARVPRAAGNHALAVRRRLLPHATAALLRGTRHALCGEGSPVLLPQPPSTSSHCPAALQTREAAPLMPTGHVTLARCVAGVSGHARKPVWPAAHDRISGVSFPSLLYCTRPPPPPTRPSRRSDASSDRSVPRDTAAWPSLPRGWPARSATPAARSDTRPLRWRRNASPTAEVLDGTPLAARQTRSVHGAAAARAGQRHRLARARRRPLETALLDGLALHGGWDERPSLRLLHEGVTAPHTPSAEQTRVTSPVKPMEQSWRAVSPAAVAFQ